MYCDDTCVLGVLDLAQYTHMKQVAAASESNESVVYVCVVCVRVYECVCVCV